MNSLNRSVRLGKLLHKEISLVIFQYVKDIRLKNIVTVSDVIVSSDLCYAKIFVTFLGISNHSYIKYLLYLLKKSTGFIKFHIGKNIYLRNIPNLIFFYDSSYNNGIRLFQSLKKD